MEIGSLPLHPLVVHAAVVFTPVLAILAIVYGVWRNGRDRLRLPTAVLAVVTAVTDYVAKISGSSLLHKLQREGLQDKWLSIHQHRAHILLLLVAALVVVTLVATYVVRRSGWMATAVAVVLVGLGVATLVSVYLTGDAGARAVWAPTS